MHARDFAAAFSRVRYSREHSDVNALAAALPFAATRASDNGVLHPHRAALADALTEAGRDDEAAVAGDPSKHIAVEHVSPDDGWSVGEWSGYEPAYGLGRYVNDYLRAALWTTDEQIGDHTRSLDENYSPYHFTDEAQHRAHHDINKFLAKLSLEARDEIEGHGDLGHNLWLSRNGHGSGYFDSGLEHADEMQAAAKSLGEQHVDVEPVDEDTTHLHLVGGRE